MKNRTTSASTIIDSLMVMPLGASIHYRYLPNDLIPEIDLSWIQTRFASDLPRLPPILQSEVDVIPASHASGFTSRDIEGTVLSTDENIQTPPGAVFVAAHPCHLKGTEDRKMVEDLPRGKAYVTTPT